MTPARQTMLVLNFFFVKVLLQHLVLHPLQNGLGPRKVKEDVLAENQRVLGSLLYAVVLSAHRIAGMAPLPDTSVLATLLDSSAAKPYLQVADALIDELGVRVRVRSRGTTALTPLRARAGARMAVG
jgi:hypothetical protein